MHFFLSIYMLLSLATGQITEPEFYKSFSDGSLQEINQLLDKLEQRNELPKYRAYKGALMMKKSHFIKKPKDKIAVFNEGKKLLEKEIQTFPNNTEFRFLRFIVQENAPKIVKYNKKLATDKAFIINHYPTLPNKLKQHIFNYAGQSELLNKAELK